MKQPSTRHPVVEGVRLLAGKALEWEGLAEEDRQSLADLLRALPTDQALEEWAVHDSWCIQVTYPVFEGGNPSGLAVVVDLAGITASITEIFRSEYGSDSVTQGIVDMRFEPGDEASRLRAAEDALVSADVFLEHVRMIDPREGYAFSVA